MQRLSGLVVVWLMISLAACSIPNIPQLPGMPDLGQLPDIPGMPTELADMPGLLQDLGLGELVNLEELGLDELPGLDSLPMLRTRPGALALRGPLERRIGLGEQIPGTDIVLVDIEPDGAVFQIAGLRSVRTYADSLDFDGSWGDVQGVEYSLRLRIYQIGRDSIRAAGVHQLEILESNPQPTGPIVGSRGRTELRFPVTWGVNRGAGIPGTTLRYVGSHERGGEIGPVDDDVYPYHKVGDSIRWRGEQRPNVHTDYQLRMLSYGEQSARVGGMVVVTLTGE